MAQRVKNPPAMRKTRVRPLCQEDTLEKGMVTHASILAWEIPWTEEPGGLQSLRSQESDTTEATSARMQIESYCDHRVRVNFWTHTEHPINTSYDLLHCTGLPWWCRG